MEKYFKWNLSFLILCLVCLTYNGNAQQVNVSAKLGRSTIALGDQTKLFLSVSMPSGEQLSFPALADTISSKIQIVALDKTDTLPDKDNSTRQTITREYTITSFDPGIQIIPAFIFKSRQGDFKTLAIPLEVLAVKVDTTKAIHDIKQPLSVSYSWMDWLRDNWLWLLIALIAILMLAGLTWYLKKRKIVAPAVKKVKIVVPPHIEALDRLNVLKAKKLWQQDLLKEYHSELTDIVRDYLEKRYGINAMEQTSEEIFTSTKDLAITAQSRDQLRQILLLADQVKFAKGNPEVFQNEQSMEYAIQFITATRDLGPSPENKANQEHENV